MTTTWSLAIDLGTVNTAAAVVVDGVIRPLDLDGGTVMASAVHRRADGTLLTGAEAVAALVDRPDAGTLSPARQVGSPAPFLFGDTVVTTVEALGAVIARVAEHGRALLGEGPERLALTHPARWESRRQRVLRDAALAAGLPEPLLVEEPVAVAAHHDDGAGEAGDLIAVLDLGADGAEMAVLRRSADGFEVVGMPRGDDSLGGDQLDHAVFGHLGSLVAEDDPAVWEAMSTADEPVWRQATADLAHKAREAKEALSLQARAEVEVPASARSFTVTRAELEGLLRPHLERAVDVLAITVASAGVRDTDITAVHLVGGSARIPLAARLLAERFGERLVLRDDPTRVVALGAARLLSGSADAAAADPGFGGGSGPAEPAAPAAPDLPASGVRPSQLERPPVSQVPSVSMPTPAAAPEAQHQPAPESQGVDGPLDMSQEQSAGVAWQVQLARVPTGIGVGAGAAAAADEMGELTLLDAPSGTRRWSMVLGVPQAAPTLAATSVPGDALLLSAGQDGRLLALSAADGSLRWQVQVGAGGAHRPTLVGRGADALVLVATGAGLVHCIHLETGAIVWQLQCHTTVAASPVGSRRQVVLVATDGSVYGLDTSTGAAAWSFRSAAGIVAQPAVADDLVHLGGLDGMVTCLDASTGQPRWGLITSNQVQAPPLRAGQRIVVVCADGVLHDIDAATGTLQWRWPAPGLCGVPAVLERTVLVPTGEGQLCAVDTATRQLRWRALVGWRYYATPVLSEDAPSGSMAVVGSAHAVIMALQAVPPAHG